MGELPRDTELLREGAVELCEEPPKCERLLPTLPEEREVVPRVTDGCVRSVPRRISPVGLVVVLPGWNERLGFENEPLSLPSVLPW